MGGACEGGSDKLTRGLPVLTPCCFPPFVSGRYSFGILLWVLWTGKRDPYAHRPDLGHFELSAYIHSDGGRPQFPVGAGGGASGDGGDGSGSDGACLQGVVALAVRCWSASPAERPSFEEVLVQLCVLGTELELILPS